MSSRKTVNVYNIKGEKSSTAALPKVFDTPVRADLVASVYKDLAKNLMQPHGTSPKAGIRPSAASWGTGRAKARVPRVNGSGSNRNGQAAYANFARGGHRFGPPKLTYRWFHAVPIKQRRYAIASAIAASQVQALVEARGHEIKELNEIPVVVTDEIEKLQKTKDAVAFLKAIKAYADVKRVIDGKYHRSSKGSMRRSSTKTKRGPLVVYNKDEGVVKAFRNIPGVEIQSVHRLSIYQLAPAGKMGRLVIWTESAFKALDEIYENKKGFTLPHSIVTNADVERIIYSDEVQAVIKPAQVNVALPKVRCPCRLGIACDEWKKALDEIAALRAAEEAKNNTPEAIKALFDEVVAAQPEPPENLSIAVDVKPGYFDALHQKEDDLLEAQLEADKPVEEKKEEEPADAAPAAGAPAAKAAPAPKK
ncbi:ribosomal protein [Histomonas meleagridis]|uniref:ribosomal protein n=1 Tax=Histomonas meleagridis TaxID=135588 RepID=UPI00355A1453|nr:ribosomal protein [Histomonas meleagridis]KAH0796806.1 ribosomal protein [Histomonas meleagridis]